jgi:redox-sensitive bicupin YhaK (pirin superfamily)
MKTARVIEKIVSGQATQDGAGVSLKRIIGQSALPRLDPFLMLDEFGSDRPQDYISGFPEHPHRGFQTVTYMLAGKMEHRDSVGNRGIIESGGIQWMNAGRGIIHSEMPMQTEGLIRGFQLWVNLPAKDKMSEPSYQDIPASQVPVVNMENGTQVKILSGKFNQVKGPVCGQSMDLLFLDVQIAAEQSLNIAISTGHAAFIYCYEGSLIIQGEALIKGELAVLSKGDCLDVVGKEASSFIIVAGQAINEPIVQHGPFVMNSESEIRQAVHDFQTGRLAQRR